MRIYLDVEPEAFAGVIERRRRQLHVSRITYSDIVKALDISRDAISYLANGGTISWENLIAICNFLHCTPYEILSPESWNAVRSLFLYEPPFERRSGPMWRPLHSWAWYRGGVPPIRLYRYTSKASGKPLTPPARAEFIEAMAELEDD